MHFQTWNAECVSERTQVSKGRNIAEVDANHAKYSMLGSESQNSRRQGIKGALGLESMRKKDLRM